ncbi:MAG: tripartite tricarboxylate transporter substrate binding protein [Pseudomonadota bacterium]
MTRSLSVLRRVALLSAMTTGGAVLLTGTLVPNAQAQAQAFPVKPLRLILPFPPGGPTDMLGRSVGAKLSEQVGQPVTVDNRPGAGGNLGLEVASKAPADGYTMVLSSPLISISPSLYAKLNYDPMKDLAPISLLAVIQNILIVHPSVPAKNLGDLVKIARANPGRLNYSSGGVGTTGHLAAELLNSLMKIRTVHVPYKGSGQALVGLMSGETDMLIMAAAVAAPQVTAGKVKGIALLSEKRVPNLPNVPTAAESGVQGFEVPIWYGMLAPSGTTREIIGRLNAEIVKALASPDLRDKLAASGIESRTSTPEQFAEFIRSEAVRYGKVIRDAGIKGE